MKLSKEQVLMINGALGEYRLSLTESEIWTNEDEKNYESILDRLQKEYVKLCVKEKK